jgi:hypothetical protein
MEPALKGLNSGPAKKLILNLISLRHKIKFQIEQNNGTCSQGSEFWSGEKVEGGDDHCADAESHYDRQVDYLKNKLSAFIIKQMIYFHWKAIAFRSESFHSFCGMNFV